MSICTCNLINFRSILGFLFGLFVCFCLFSLVVHLYSIGTLLPMATAQLLWMPSMNPELHMPVVRFIYRSVRQLDNNNISKFWHCNCFVPQSSTYNSIFCLLPVCCLPSSPTKSFTASGYPERSSTEKSATV